MKEEQSAALSKLMVYIPLGRKKERVGKKLTTCLTILLLLDMTMNVITKHGDEQKDIAVNCRKLEESQELEDKNQEDNGTGTGDSPRTGIG